ncbi:MAG TPA: SRPBCC family protein [Rhodospirillaceae bacterium]|nr:SRPBCC family protein [Rhodospirillaceae bacterium]
MKFSRLFAVAALTTAIAFPAAALEVKKSVSVAAGADEVWKTIGGFCGIAEWHPAIAKCELSKKGSAVLRTLSLNGGGTVVEKLLRLNDEKYQYTYSVVAGPLPVDQYKSTLLVKKFAGGSTITWVGSFVAKGAPDAKAIEVISGVYEGGLASLKKKLTK